MRTLFFALLLSTGTLRGQLLLAQTYAAPLAAASNISGTIDAAPEVKSSKTNWTLYVVAYEFNQRTGMPAAVVRIPNPKFPHDFKMGPENVMVAGREFKGPFFIKAKVTARGDVITQPGDWEGVQSEKTGIMPGTKGLKIKLNEKRK